MGASPDSRDGIHRRSRAGVLSRAIACLVVGLVLTVVVAWASVLLAIGTRRETIPPVLTTFTIWSSPAAGTSAGKGVADPRVWPLPTTVDWPAAPVMVVVTTAFGCREVEAGRAERATSEGAGTDVARAFEQVSVIAGWPFAALGAAHARVSDYQPGIGYGVPPMSIFQAPPWLGIPSMLRVPLAFGSIRMFLDGVPTKPQWPGFLANTLIYAGAIAVGVWGPKALVRAHRRRRDRCVECGYLHPAPRCPECGAAVTRRSVDTVSG